MKFSVVGISHWKSEVSIRELFYLNNQRKKSLLERTNSISDGILLLDTCNRTEVYGFCEPEDLLTAFCEATETEPSFFQDHGYIHAEMDAFQHFYKVATGLDSQVLGDIQIIQQVKKAYAEAKKFGLSGEFHQLIQSVFRAHKRSRTETDFARGTASVGFAATQLALEHFNDLSEIKVLLVGAGKMGKISCKNLVSKGASHIAVINRSINRAKQLASTFDITAHSYDELQAEIDKADLIIAATGSKNPIILPEHFHGAQKKKLVIDLSVPRNVDPKVAESSFVELVDMDSIHSANSEAIQGRKKAIPLVQDIIEDEFKAYLTAVNRSKFLFPRIKEIDAHLEDITQKELDRVKNKLDEEAFEHMQKVTNRIKKKILAVHIERIESEFEKQFHEA